MPRFVASTRAPQVDIINSVQFSNHTGYPAGWKGEVLQGAQLDDLIDGLETNHLLSGYSAVLTGYIGSKSFLIAVMKTVQRLRQASPHVSFLCDPVMGDHGKLYVPEELVKIYREQVRGRRQHKQRAGSAA
jgi:pyridoxine kinase